MLLLDIGLAWNKLIDYPRLLYSYYTSYQQVVLVLLWLWIWSWEGFGWDFVFNWILVIYGLQYSHPMWFTQNSVQQMNSSLMSHPPRTFHSHATRGHLPQILHTLLLLSCSFPVYSAVVSETLMIVTFCVISELLFLFCLFCLTLSLLVCVPLWMTLWILWSTV